MPIQAVFLDFGNIFSTFDFRRFYLNLCTSADVRISEEEFNILANRHYWPYDRGDVTPIEYYHGLATDARIDISQEKFEACFLDIFHGPVIELDGLLGRVHEDITLYLLSNTNQLHYERYIREHPFLWNHIPGRRHILSFHVGASKPDPKIYHHAFAISGVQSYEAFFVDDLDANIRSWQELGGHGIVWHGANHDIETLERAFDEHAILA